MQTRPAAPPGGSARAGMSYWKHDRGFEARAAANAPSPRQAPPARRRYAWVGTAASLVIFGASLYVLWRIGSQMDAAEVRAAFTAATARQLGMAAALTVVSYLLLTC